MINFLLAKTTAFFRKHGAFYFLLFLSLWLFYTCMTKDWCPFIHISESVYVTSDATFLIKHFRFFPFPHVEFLTDYFAFPYQMRPVFLTWMLEHDFLCGALFEIFGMGPWEQLYWLLSLFASAAITYHLLRSFGGFNGIRSTIFALVVTFCNYAAICKYPAHYTLVIYHWVIINMVMDFLMVKLYFEKKHISSSFILLKIFFLLMALGLELGYIAGGAFTSFILSGCFILLWEGISKKSLIAPFRFVWSTLKGAFQKDFFRCKTNYLLILLILIPLYFYFPIALQIAWIAKHGEVASSVLVQSAPLYRALLPIFPGWNPLSNGIYCDTIYANSTGWTFLLLVIIALLFGKKRIWWIVPFLALYLLCLLVVKIPVLKYFPWFSYARFSERFSPLLVPCLAMAFLILPDGLLRKFWGIVFSALLACLFAFECSYAYKHTFTWIDTNPVVGLDDASQKMLDQLREMEGDAVFFFPFAIAGGDENAAAGTSLSGPLAQSMQLASFIGKKTNSFYGGRLDCSADDLPLAAEKHWDAILTEAKTGTVSEHNLRILTDFVEKNDFCAILLWRGWVSPAFCEQMYQHFGRPVISCNYGGHAADVLKINRRYEDQVFYGKKFSYFSLLSPADDIVFSADTPHCLTRGFSGMWGCGPRYSLTFLPKTRAPKYHITITATSFLVPDRQEEKMIQIKHNGKVVCTRKYHIAQPETLRDLDFDVETDGQDDENAPITLNFSCLSPQKSPAALGAFRDGRVLSLAFNRLICRRGFLFDEISESTLPCTLSEEFPHLKFSGFSYRWQIDPSGQLQIPFAKDFDSDLTIDLDGDFFIWQGMPTQTMTISAKGRELASYSYDMNAPMRKVSFKVPKELISDGVLSLDIKFKNPSKSPKDLGLSEDARGMYFYFKSITVKGAK